MNTFYVELQSHTWHDDRLLLEVELVMFLRQVIFQMCHFVLSTLVHSELKFVFPELDVSLRSAEGNNHTNGSSTGVVFPLYSRLV